MTFENKFFHSTVAYPTEQSFETFREKLLAAASDPKWPAATRAALGLMAATTVEPAHYPRTYEPFSDAWAPEVLLELKSNHGKLYGALTESKPAGEALHPAVRVIRERMIAERKAGVKSGAIVDPGALIAELNQVTTPLTAADAQIAARYLRFDYTALPKLDARTPWAKLAALRAPVRSRPLQRLRAALGRARRTHLTKSLPRLGSRHDPRRLRSSPNSQR